MVVEKKISLRQLVFQYYEKHPLEVNRRDNTMIYEKFNATAEKEQMKISTYKTQYKSLLEQNQIKKEPSKRERARKGKKVLPARNNGFEWFCRWLGYPDYGGLDGWQKEHDKLTKKAKYEMTCVHRDAGKSVKYNWRYEYRLVYKVYDVLLLGWTARYKQIALYVYTFCDKYDLIEKDQRTSPFHFKLKNGGRFDCYLITSKETLGMHSEGEQDRFKDLTEAEWAEFKSGYSRKEWEAIVQAYKEEDSQFDENHMREYLKTREGSIRKLWISIDDPIDISFMKERHKEEGLELRFDSTLYSINPDKWSFTGTRKFEGDFFDFIEGKFKSKLVKYIRGPINEDGSLLCPERFTHPSLPTYEQDISKVDEKGNPKKPKKDLQEIRESIGEYAWFSDWCQNPHPITGEVWNDIEEVYALDTPVNRKHDLLIVSMDRATTSVAQTKATTAFTGCPVLVRELQTGDLIIIEDFTDHINFDDLLLKINEFGITWKKKHEQQKLILIEEEQGGGKDFVTMAKRLRGFFNEKGELVENRIPYLYAITEVHNTGDKLQRIKDRLYVPIKNGKIKILSALRHSEIRKEILTFPNCAKLDALDALANVQFEVLENYPAPTHGSRIKDIVYVMDDYEKRELEKQRKKQWKNRPSILGKLENREKRRTVFGN